MIRIRSTQGKIQRLLVVAGALLMVMSLAACQGLAPAATLGVEDAAEDSSGSDAVKASGGGLVSSPAATQQNADACEPVRGR